MRRLQAWILLALGVWAMGGCTFGLGAATTPDEKDAQPKETAPGAQRIIVPVEAAHPTRGSISAYFETTTRVEAERRVEVTSEGMGRCLGVFAEEGDAVEKGQTLVELDKKDVEAQLNQSEVQVRQTQSEFERARKLFDDDLISRVEYDNARFAYENAQAALDVQRIQLENMTIRAPISGVVTRRSVQVGTLVSSGMPVFEIVDPTSYLLYIHPPERELPRLKEGQLARVSVDALQGEELTAAVDRINPSVDPATGTVRVRLELDPEVRPRLRESAFARVRLVMETREDALLVPRDAIVDENARKYVFVVRSEPPADAEVDAEAVADGAEDRLFAHRVEVRTGLQDGAATEIVSGLDDQDRIVTLGQRNLKAGAEVRVTSTDAEIAALRDKPIDAAIEEAERERAEIEKRIEERKAREAEQARAALFGATSGDADAEGAPADEDEDE